ncbi:MAG: ubiquitin carboxyl-terminal hydrolase family protein [Oligoflexales bacterium]
MNISIRLFLCQFMLIFACDALAKEHKNFDHNEEVQKLEDESSENKIENQLKSSMNESTEDWRNRIIPKFHPSNRPEFRKLRTLRSSNRKRKFHEYNWDVGKIILGASIGVGILTGTYLLSNIFMKDRLTFEFTDGKGFNYNIQGLEYEQGFEPDSKFKHTFKPGLPNLGNTCFANSATVLLFELNDFPNFIGNPLARGALINFPYETTDQWNLRKTFKKSTLNLHNKRQNLLGTEKSSGLVQNELNLFFDSLTATSKNLDGTERIGGFDGARLRREQGDSRDFAAKVLEYLEYPYPKFREIVNFVDGDRKIIRHDEHIINLNVDADKLNFDGEIAPSFSSVLNIKTMVNPMTGDNQIINNNGIKLDSHVESGLVASEANLIFRLDRVRSEQNANGEWFRTKFTAPINVDHRIEVPYYRHNGDRLGNIAYNLKAVSIHQGRSHKSGHYYTYVYDNKFQGWMVYNDSQVIEVSAYHALADIRNNGYLYLYELTSNE